MFNSLTKIEVMIGSVVLLIAFGSVLCVDQTALNLSNQAAAFSYSNSQLQNNQKPNLNNLNPPPLRPNINSNPTPLPISLSYGGAVNNNQRQNHTGLSAAGPTGYSSSVRGSNTQQSGQQPPVNTEPRPANVQFINTKTGSNVPSRSGQNQLQAPNPSSTQTGQNFQNPTQYPSLPGQRSPNPATGQANPFPALPGQQPGRVQSLLDTFSGSQSSKTSPPSNPQNRPEVQPGRVQTLINTYSGQTGSNTSTNIPNPHAGGSKPFSYSGALKGSQPGAQSLPKNSSGNQNSNVTPTPNADPQRESAESGTSAGPATDAELAQLSEALLKKDVNNAAKYLTVNYQSKTTSGANTDEAPLPLLTVNCSAYEIPTIAKIRPLFNNYVLETDTNEHVTAQERSEEGALLDAVLSTSLMRHLMTFLQQKGKVILDPKSHKDLLKTIWFTLYSRGRGIIGSSAFEHVFLSELKRGEVSGLHNWIYFSDEEMANLVNYMGYMKKVELGQKGSILKLRFNRGSVKKPVNSMFIGTSPELEMALYTACFVLRPDTACPIVLAGNSVTIRTHTFRYRGKNMIGSAFPEI